MKGESGLSPLGVAILEMGSQGGAEKGGEVGLDHGVGVAMGAPG